MRKVLFTLAPALFLFFVFTRLVEAHSGRTDSSGGHNCSSSSVAKGLCTGYHYHNGGGYTAPVNRVPVATVKPSTPKPATPKASIKPTSTPTIEPTPVTTEIPTSSPVPEVKGVQTSPTPIPEPLTGGQTAVSLLVLGAGSFGVWKFFKFLGKNTG